MKIIDKINQAAEIPGNVFYSFEFFPPKTQAGVENLYCRMDRMASLEPLFCDVTWGAGGSTSDLTIEISSNAQKFCDLEVLMHLTCTNMHVSDLRNALNAAIEAGISNILALRGDPPKGCHQWKAADHVFSHAVDLVKFIRKEYGDKFCIGVAGHPEGHSEAVDPASDLLYLKEKIDAGADFVITQLFYDTDKFLNYAAECRKIGITCPIIPGIMPIQSYNGFKRMTAYCKTYIPQEILDALEFIKDNDEEVKNYGIDLGTRMCKKLIEGGVKGLHFYTLNLEKSTRKILESLGLTGNNIGKRNLPWRPSPLLNRASEDVRPIYWANCPKSYLKRTSSWDEFPNGRWGDNRSPAFGDLSDSHYTRINIGTIEDCKAMWGESPIELDEIYETFARYIMGTIPRLPWCELQLQLETQTIQEKLAELNRNGFLTINSQPRVCAAPSDHPIFGWGGPGGLVYQKAYVECFVSPENLKFLMRSCDRRKSIQYLALDSKGNSYSSPGKGVTAVTWGIFPNKEILQPTVVDPESFNVWKDEAFALWLTLWASLYHEESTSHELIHKIHDEFFLVSIVDNDFMHGDIWTIFERPDNEAF